MTNVPSSAHVSPAGVGEDPISLLWPPGTAPAPGERLGTGAMADLTLHEVIRALSGYEARRERFVTNLLAQLCADPAVIVYRAEIVDELLDDAGLREDLRRVLPGLEALAQGSRRHRDEWAVYTLVQRLAELAAFVEVALQLHGALQRAELRAPALRRLRVYLQDLIGTAEFQALREELPALEARLSTVRSVTVGINLSGDLTPESAVILSLNSEKIDGRGMLLERLLGWASGRRGLTPLRAGDMGLDNHIVRDMRRLLERVIAPVEQALGRYNGVQVRVLRGLEAEISFLLNGVALIERLRDVGLPVCRPAIAPAGERITDMREGYNVSLALQLLGRAETPPAGVAAAITTNDLVFDERNSRVWILTGPNRGGKTTYIRAAGLAHALAQAGLYVPARSARLSPVDAIYTHFPAQESGDPGRGRLDDEAALLATIFQCATPRSLILLNEVLSGTSAVEALGLAIDAVRGLRLLGARAIYATHLHELAQRAGEMNARTSGDGTIGSLVAGVEAGAGDQAMHRRTFRIRPGPPHRLSYASEIAAQHGISFPQLERLLRRRGVVPGATGDPGDAVS